MDFFEAIMKLFRSLPVFSRCLRVVCEIEVKALDTPRQFDNIPSTDKQFSVPCCFAKTLVRICDMDTAREVRAGNDLTTPGQESSRYRFDRLTMRQGLSQNGVICLLQDRRGFVWIGTEDGLNRYDGTQFRIYNHDPASPDRSLSSGDVHSLYEDRSGTLWVGTYDRGLNRYSRKRDEFTPCQALPFAAADNQLAFDSLYILSICETDDHNLWLGCAQGLVQYNLATGRYHHHHSTLKIGLIYSVLALNTRNAILIGSQFGLFLFNLDSHTFTNLNASTNAQPLTTVSVLTKADANSVWVVTMGGQLKLFDIPSLTVSDVQTGLEPDKAGVHFGGMAVAPDGILWLAGTDGLWCVDPANPSRSEIIRSHPENPHSLPHDFLLSCMIDAAGSLWCATRAGAALLHLRRRSLDLYDRFAMQDMEAASHYVNSLAAAENGACWIGSSDGLYLFDPHSKVLERHGYQPAARLQSQDINALAVDLEGRVLVGYERGMAFYDPLAGRIVESVEFSGIVIRLFVGRRGDILAGVAHVGLSLRKFQEKNHKIYSHDPNDPYSLASNYVVAIGEDTSGTFWIGTTNGIQWFDAAGERFERPGAKHLFHKPTTVLGIFQARDGALWLADKTGLFVIDDPRQPAKLRFVPLELGGLKTSLYGIEQDTAGQLWIASSSRGLIRFDPATGHTRLFGMDDMAQDDEFNLSAHAQLADGRLAFGGPGGFNIVDPTVLRDNLYEPPVLINELKVFNKPVQLHAAQTDAYSLPAVVSEMQHIRFSWRESVFSLECVALNFIQPWRNRYAWKLEGWDRDWVEAGTARQATYTNLDAGDYIFRVIAANNDGKWSSQGASLRISISPPPWKTWWAYGAYASAGIAGILAFTRARVAEQTREIEAQNAIERAKVAERENMRRKNAADFHDEAGNKLTKIMLYTELVKRSSDNPKVTDLMSKIESNAGGLSSGMRDFIWVLDPARDTLSDTVTRLQDFGADLFQDVPVEFTVDIDAPEIEGQRLALEIRRELLLIFKEAMHNTLKYAQSNHTLLSVRLRDSILTIAFVDDGRGFDTALHSGGQNSSGYGLRNMRSRATKISAELILRSRPDQGTALAVSLQLPPSDQA